MPVHPRCAGSALSGEGGVAKSAGSSPRRGGCWKVSRPAGPRAGTPPTTSSSTGLRTRGSGPPAAPAAGCLILPPGAGRRTAGWRGPSPSPFPGWACGILRCPGVRVITGPSSLRRLATACSGGGGDAAVFSGGRGLPVPVVLGGLGACFPARRRAWSPPPRGCLHPCCPGASGHPSGPAFRAALTEAFLPFLPGVFLLLGECRRARARRKITGPQKTHLCKKNARGCPATAQIGRLCKKNVRGFSRGYRGGLV